LSNCSVSNVFSSSDVMNWRGTGLLAGRPRIWTTSFSISSYTASAAAFDDADGAAPEPPGVGLAAGALGTEGEVAVDGVGDDGFEPHAATRSAMASAIASDGRAERADTAAGDIERDCRTAHRSARFGRPRYRFLNRLASRP
jgi:hypothetical protein